MDLRLTTQQQRLVEAARGAAERLAPVAGALDRGDLSLADELRRVRTALPTAESELELVLVVEQLAQGSASLATGYWLAEIVHQFGGAATELTEVHGLRRLLATGGGAGEIAATPAEATSSVEAREEPAGVTLVRSGAMPAMDSDRRLSGLQSLRLTVETVGPARSDRPTAGRPQSEMERRARLGHAAVCVGVAQRALDEACHHLTSRVKMPENQPLSTFQGLRFMVADVDAALESARWPLYAAAEGAGRLDEASWLALTAVQLATNTALQIAGGSGFSPDRPFERLARDAWALVALGT